MPVVVHRLQEKSPEALLEHFRVLGAEDRRLRFGAPLDPDGIARYVDRIDFARDAVYAVYDDDLSIVGAAHLAMAGEHTAELGLSVHPDHRHQGVGGALFERASEHARNSRFSRLYMH